MTTQDAIDTASVRFVEQGKWRFGTLLRVRRGGHTAEVRVGRRIVLVHPERLHSVRDRRSA